MDDLAAFERDQSDRLTQGGKPPAFRPGDTLRVHVRVVEGERERIQLFEGVCIAKRRSGVQASFTLRKVSYGEGVERVFPLLSPRLARIDVVRRGKVRRAKLYYLRGRTGRKARIAEKRSPPRKGAEEDNTTTVAAESKADAEGIATQKKDEKGAGKDAGA